MHLTQYWLYEFASKGEKLNVKAYAMRVKENLLFMTFNKICDTKRNVATTKIIL